MATTKARWGMSDFSGTQKSVRSLMYEGGYRPIPMMPHDELPMGYKPREKRGGENHEMRTAPLGIDAEVTRI